MKRLISIDTDQGYKKGIEMASNILKNNGVIAIPTDTIYGICSSLSNTNKIYDIKKREHCKPLGIFLPNIESIDMIAIVPDSLKSLLNKLLPGPVTLLFKRSPLLPESFNPGIDTIGIRIPESRFVQDLVKHFGEPIAQTSANKSGATLNPTSIYHFSDIWDDLNLIVDGDNQFSKNESSKCHPGSTIIDLTNTGYFSIIRDGIIKEKAEKILTDFGLDNIKTKIETNKMSVDIVHMCKLFEEKYGVRPQWKVRCPGRVNLIGEHIDYSDYSVLPMAIDRATFILGIECNEDILEIANVEKEIYPEKKIFLNEIKNWHGCNNPTWIDYYLCGWKGIIEFLNEDNECKIKGMKLLVWGDIPPSSGVSSSSSIVCGSALMTLAIQTNGKHFEIINKGDFAELCAKSERYIGVEGGGMDQACEVLAQNGHALRIDFKPLIAHPISLPQDAIFAVIHSGSSHNKASNNYYNQRVVECRLGAQIIAKLQNYKHWMNIRTLGQLSKEVFNDIYPKNMYNIAIEKLKSTNGGKYTREEVKEILEIDDNTLISTSLNSNTTEMKEFVITPRVLHCFSEADRVFEFEKACENNEISLMAALMNESHKSCKELYECSCEELDSTVKICLESGFLAARLTGAGWGGCVIALTTMDMKDKLEEKVNILFWSHPSKGIDLTNIYVA
uniref:Threonylcarbamoyl-AMP synthase n=1 Tax=Strongyloides stercoralis TaxID=6248 RepID=A0AAF5D3B0_STRER